MKSTAILLMATALFIASCSSTTSEKKSNEEVVESYTDDLDATFNKKYGVKNGTIQFESQMKGANFDLVGKSIVYFDDYGIKERKDTYDEDGMLKESFLSDGKTLYLLIHKNKAAYKRGNTYRGTEMKFDWDEIPSDKKSSGEAIKGPNENILGKDCEVYFFKGSKFAGWKNICLLTEVEGSGVSNKVVAIKIQEEPVSAELFSVPSDYTVQ
ncbi:MAG: hypothetical protein ABIN48_13615 [Ginsengibacter sp.]